MMNAELFCQARTILSLTPMIVAFKSQHETKFDTAMAKISLSDFFIAALR